MKLSKSLLILSAAMLLGLSACNNETSQSKFVPVDPSSETSESTSTSEGDTSSEDISSQDTSSQTSSSETSSSEESSEQNPDELSGKLEFFNGAETTPFTSVKEMSGAKTARVTLENLPAGKSISDYSLVLPRQSALATIVNDNDDQGDFTFSVVPMAAGIFKGAIKVMDGASEVLQIPYELNIEPDLTLTDYVALTKNKIIELNKKNAGDNGRYYLAEDIDMGGTTLAQSGTTFTGSIYGAGHTISNFSVVDESGIFLSFQGVIFDINLEGTLNASTASWAGLIAKETSWRAVTSNVRAIVTDASGNPSDWTWCRNGGLFGMTRGLIQDCVVDVTNCASDRTFPFAAYSNYVNANNYDFDKDNAFVDGCYTNAKGNVSLPFGPSPSDGWNSAPNPDSNFVADIVWASATAATYKLDTSIWTITAGQIPSLTVK